MHGPMHLSYDAADDGGVTITICHGSEPGGPLAAVLKLDHRGALAAAANILYHAGVERAEFEGTCIRGMARP